MLENQPIEQVISSQFSGATFLIGEGERGGRRRGGGREAVHRKTSIIYKRMDGTVIYYVK